jgi:hypothetical protein
MQGRDDRHVSQISYHQKAGNGIGWLLTACAVITLVIGLAVFSSHGKQGTTSSPKPPLVDDGHDKPELPEILPKTIPNHAQNSRLTELRGSLARQREYDLWLLRNIQNVMNSQSQQEKILSYCMTTVYGAERLLLDSAPETEYALQTDGTVLRTSGKPPKTLEQQFRDGQRMQFELQTGGGPVVQDCAGSLSWFGTWHNQPMPSREKLMELADDAVADVNEIDSALDPRLVEVLPKPNAE